MTTYLTRDKWTSTSAGGATLTGTKLVGIAVHWPGTTLEKFGEESQAKVAERLRGWRHFHVVGRGWSDIGYNFAIDQAGRVWQCRTTNWKGNRVGAHSASASNPDANHERVGVLLILGAKESLSAKMIQAFQDWRYTHFLSGWPGRTDLRGHGQVPGAQTSCPGPQARGKISDGTLAKKPTGGTVALSNTYGSEAAKDVWNDSIFVKQTNSEQRMRAYGYLTYVHKYSIAAKDSAAKAHAAAVANGKELATIKAELAAIRSALQQVLTALAAGNTNVTVDMAAVADAAKRGAEDALDAIDFQFTVTASPDVEEDDGTQA